MQVRTKRPATGGRPRQFDVAEALAKMQRQLWTSGLSGISLDGIARSAGINRPSLAAAFGDKDAIYTQAAVQYIEMMDQRLRSLLGEENLEIALTKTFDAAIDIYTADGSDGCFVICTAPAEALTNTVCRGILDQSLQAIDALFLERLEKEAARVRSSPDDLALLAMQLGATLHSIALRARAGWDRGKLKKLAFGAVRQVLACLGQTHGSESRARRRARPASGSRSGEKARKVRS